MPLTADQIREAAPGAQTYELHDARGLVLRVYPTGLRAWRVEYWERGRKLNRTVGHYPNMGLEAAREERDRRRMEAAKPKDITFEAFSRVYLRWSACNKKDKGERDRYLIDRYMRNARVVPRGCRRPVRFGDRPLAQITRSECSQVLGPIIERGTQAMAARVHSCMRRVFSYYIDSLDEDLVNPAARMNISQGPARDRVLSAPEIQRWWPVFTAMAPPGPRIAAGLILATMQRPGEVLEFEVSEIDTVDLVWNLPANKAKNGQANTVPLTPWAIELIDEALERWPGADRLVPISDDTVRNWMAASWVAAEIDRVTPHDLRRTGATWLGKLEVTDAVQDKILNHIDQSVRRIYNRYDYLKEKQSALEAWSECFHKIVSSRHPDHHRKGDAKEARAQARHVLRQAAAARFGSQNE